MGLLLRWLILTAAILFASYLVEGIKVSGFFSALWAAAILGILNALLRPILFLLTLPVNILTFGLFTFVINAILRQIVENITADYRGLLISDLQPLITLQNKITNGGNPPGGYWSGQTYASSIQIVENSCLDDIHKDDTPPAGEVRAGNSDCLPQDTLLKVTLAYDGESLTMLFSR